MMFFVFAPVKLTSPHTSSHSSLRHRRFFDIIKSMGRSNTELQLRPPTKHFSRWVQKSFSCKVDRLHGRGDPLIPFRHTCRSSYLIHCALTSLSLASAAGPSFPAAERVPKQQHSSIQIINHSGLLPCSQRLI